MKFAKKILFSSISWVLLLCSMFVGYNTSMWAAGGPPKATIYSAALDNPAFPVDTVDAQLKKLSAQAWLMINAEDGRILSCKNPNKIMYPASMTKMMTCILACESGYLNEIVTISKDAAETPYTNVKKGERYKLKDLLYRVMLPSDNGAAQAVGEFLSSKDSVSFDIMMNAKAKSLGMKNTNFVNAHGLPDDNHYSTAKDMMRLLRYCMMNKTFAEIVSKSSFDISTTAGTRIHLKSTVKLFDKYKGCIGVKTGTTRAAGGCLASAVVRDGMKIYLVIMKCEPARERTDESIVLYNKGFEMIKMLGHSNNTVKNKNNTKDRDLEYYDNNGRDVRNVPRPKGSLMNRDEYIKHQNDDVPRQKL